MKALLTIDLKVVPSSSFNKVTLDKTGKIVVYVKAPPEDGKANKELISFLADKLSIPKLNITIIRGLTSRKKTVKISGFSSLEDLLSKLGLDIQKSIS